MSVLINPYVFAAAGAGSITLGRTSGTQNNSMAAGWIYSAVALAAESGEIEFLTVLGSSAAASYEPYRLAVFAATDYDTVDGALLGSIDCATLGTSETRTMQLSSPITITAGNYYAFGIHTSASMNVRSVPDDANNAGRQFADTWSDGILGTGPGSTFDTGWEPIVYGSTEGTEWDGGAAMGATSGASDVNMSTNRIIGYPVVAGRDGTLAGLTILGSSAASSSADFRLCVYEVSGPSTTWGSLVAQTATTNGLGISEAKYVAFASSLSVVKGKMYALCVHIGGTTIPVRRVTNGSGVTGLTFTDTFADGTVATAGSTVNNSWAPIIYGTIT